MTFRDIQSAVKVFYPAIALDGMFSRHARGITLKLLGAVQAMAFLVWIVVEFILPAGVAGGAEALVAAKGVFFVLLPFTLLIFLLHAFVNSFYFYGFDHVHVLSERMPTNAVRISYEVAVFYFYADSSDITGSFFNYPYGRLMFERAGINSAELPEFLSHRVNRLSVDACAVVPTSPDAIRVYDLAMAIIRQDKELSQFLFSKGVQEKNFLAAANWVSRDMLSYKKSLRFWSRDRLGRIEGIGKDWSYGTAFRLRRYAYELTAMDIPLVSTKPKYIQDDVARLEAALSKAKEANALLVGEDGGSKMEVLHGFASMIKEGTVFPAIEHKKVYVFDAGRLISDSGEKTKFEYEMAKLLDEAITSGNVLLVIEDFPAFIQSAEQIGVNAVSFLSPYLDSREVQFICLASPGPFHERVEPDSMLMTKFETVILKEGESLDVLQVLQNEASKVEARQRLIIPQTVLAVIAESADRYITEGVMPNKAIDLLYELAGRAEKTQKRQLTRADVLEFVKAKTGIPTGTVSEDEKDKLINLEKILHERVIGQDEAVSAVANAMRRSRAGVSNPNRPIGSFLFMGPTGVGKTETTKALAQAFFGDDNRITRLDMSEYKAADAMPKLIGSFGANTPGVLSSMLREKPYGVLLLDEFEKASKEVVDLFLQVLDEGVFSDMRGKKVNARNMIIIATSNAGSDIIYDSVQRGEKLSEKKSEIVDTIVKQGIFRPELLNRFDAVVLFQPIDNARLRDIAKLMLEKFRLRIQTRGIDLEVTDDLIDYLMKFGSDPKFGARPMNRAIQDVVEQKIADKIIKGVIKPGEKIRLTSDDLTA